VAVASGLLGAGALAGAGAAAADDAIQHQGGAVATLDGLQKEASGEAVLRTDGKDKKILAGLFSMTVQGGGQLQTYCIDIHNPTQDQAKYVETPWGQTSLGSNADAGKIRWILQNSFPQVNDFAALAKSAEFTEEDAELNQKSAAVGTQVAIWRLSDDAEVTAVDPQAEKLADWLVESAENLAEPKASLTLEPNAVSGKPGGRLGPVTVRTDAGQASVTPPVDAAASGVKITDEAGKPVTSATDGTKLYFDVPEDAADGTAALSVQATMSVPVGRAFASETKSQTQILAGSSESTVSANATATWAKQGAIPAVSVEKNCVKGGVDVTASNKGDEPFSFSLAGVEHSIPAGESRTVTVPVAEDQAYDFTITGPGGFEKNFKGVLDCKTSSAPQEPGTETPSSEPSPASAGGTAGGLQGDLAETGGSGATPMIAGIAIAMMLAGGGAVFFLRKKKAATGA
jgi:TQXA domain-containing protein/LPXTG-motif cell wall-anchored protein